MSTNGRVTTKKIDRRIRRTRDRLGDALVALLQEKPFDTITVQEVLDRADVGRSTFYAHYRDKEDLFLSDCDEFFDAMATLLSRRSDTSDRVAPVRELFAHVAEMRAFYSALVASGRIHDVLELAQGHFARGIERRLAERRRATGTAAEERAAAAQALAGALLSLLSWWIDHGTPGSPEHMDDLYHRMVWTGVSGANALPSQR
jgi:AcrR family transcriptional regulator